MYTQETDLGFCFHGYVLYIKWV